MVVCARGGDGCVCWGWRWLCVLGVEMVVC